MTLIDKNKSVREQIWICLDLETTGLDNNVEEIIEIGAVKFKGDELLDTYQTFVNPTRQLSEFVLNYTHISQADVDSAPYFSTVAGELADFVQDFPIVGHNIPFDIGFLSKKGLALTNLLSDTWDLAYILLPRTTSYALGPLAETLGITHPQPHRALADADVTRMVFEKLVAKLYGLDLPLLDKLRQISSRSQSLLKHVIADILIEKGYDSTTKFFEKIIEPKFHTKGSNKKFNSSENLTHIDESQIRSIMSINGPLAKSLPDYESRPEQLDMSIAVSSAINSKRHLVMEGGTGTGKSLAYILPAALYSVINNKRVVISTNTINLQEQLINKDIPAAISALNETPGFPKDFLATPLKGRNNYVCLKSLSNYFQNENYTSDEIRFLGKITVWLNETSTGDVEELNLAGRPGMLWSKISAQGVSSCPSMNKGCYLSFAREQAATANIIVVNHALLMTDLSMGGGLIPEYDVVIIDEGHHLESEATKHLGFLISQNYIDGYLNAIAKNGELIKKLQGFSKSSKIGNNRRKSVEEFIGKLITIVTENKKNIEDLFLSINQFMRAHEQQFVDGNQALRLTENLRREPQWTKVEIAWEKANLSLRSGQDRLQDLLGSIEGLEEFDDIQHQAITMDLSKSFTAYQDIRGLLEEFIVNSSVGYIYWMVKSKRDDTITMNVAPLNVGTQLDELLFAEKSSVILTSATLTAKGSFKHIKERVGLTETDELLKGSPFDYKNAALLCIPDDMPEPNSWAYQAALEKGIVDVASVLKGHTMVLFTSHNALRSTSKFIRANLDPKIQVMAQGIDGSPKRIATNFIKNPNSIILGTSSFWEGVDMPGGILKAIIIARLPFNVPTDPVFQARSENVDNPFDDYAVPQAILKFRQGFGRLIRGQSDKGVVVVLDRRVLSRNYGKAFINSLPDCSISKNPLRNLRDDVSKWMKGSI